LARLLAGNLCVLLLLLGGALTLAEGYLYFFFAETDGAMVLLSSRRWIQTHVRPNASHYRGEDFPRGAPRRPGEIRIAVVGDSYAYGQGIEREEDRFTELLEASLRGRGIPASVYNLSFPGNDTPQETEVVRNLYNEGSSADLLILAYVPNDMIQEQCSSPEFEAAKARLESVPAWVSFLTERSLALSLLYHRLVTFRDPGFLGYDRMVLGCRRNDSSWQHHLLELGILVRFARLVAPTFAVVTFPLQHPAWERDEFDGLHRDLDDYWRSQGVPHLDLLPEFKKRPIRDLMAGRWDSHPGEEANRIVARAMEDWLPALLPGRL
jgi:lysophospholipase L1-like esterase